MKVRIILVMSQRSRRYGVRFGRIARIGSCRTANRCCSRFPEGLIAQMSSFGTRATTPGRDREAV